MKFWRAKQREYPAGAATEGHVGGNRPHRRAALPTKGGVENSTTGLADKDGTQVFDILVWLLRQLEASRIEQGNLLFENPDLRLQFQVLRHELMALLLAAIDLRFQVLNEVLDFAQVRGVATFADTF